jgi:hypothetical protein
MRRQFLNSRGVAEDASLPRDHVPPDERAGPDLACRAPIQTGPDDRGVRGERHAGSMWTGPSMWTPGGPGGLRAEFRCAARAGPICPSHSQGAASALKKGRNAASESGSAKKSEAFTGPGKRAQKIRRLTAAFCPPGTASARLRAGTGLQPASGSNTVIARRSPRCARPGCTRRPCPTG